MVVYLYHGLEEFTLLVGFFISGFSDFIELLLVLLKKRFF